MRTVARLGLGLLVGLAYVAASYWLMTAAPETRWNAVGMLAPMLIAIAVLSWRGGQYATSLLSAAPLVGLAALAQSDLQVSQHELFVAQHVTIHLCLALWFGMSLRRGSQALISAVAQRVHLRLPPEIASYTRRLTLVWCFYFVAMAALSVAVYGVAPFEAWAFFANWVTPLGVALMFAGEHWLRYRLHPEFERVSMARVITAYSHAPDRSSSVSGAAEPSLK